MSPTPHRHHTDGHVRKRAKRRMQAEMDDLDKQLAGMVYNPGFHGDALIGNKHVKMLGYFDDFRKIFTFKNAPEILKVIKLYLQGQGLNMKAAAQIFGSLSINSATREQFIEKQVKEKYERMLHPPLTYLGGAFKYRTADGKFNSALHPHLGQAGAPYAKTVPAITHPLGALPDPGDLFDRLMAREMHRPSESGLSSMLIYHATIIIHDIFRTNDKDKNISDTSSYLDLSPLYGFTDEMQRKVRDETYKLGLLKPDTFAEDRLLRQPPGVCIMLVMYNRYHNYAATQLRRINENGRFSVPAMFEKERTLAAAENFIKDKTSQEYKNAVEIFNKAYKGFETNERKPTADYTAACDNLEGLIAKAKPDQEKLKTFYQQYDAAWDKLDDDLFNTARLITCGLYIQVSIHDYLRALMGFHQYDTNFTLDPRLHETNAKSLSRGLGNQVTVEFNLLYRFHCAISDKDEEYTEEFMREMFDKGEEWNPKGLPLNDFMRLMGQSRAKDAQKKHLEPWEIGFGLETGPRSFKRNKVTGLFDDQKMVDALRDAMDDPISNFGPQNVPKSLKAVEIMGILQARKWEIGTLNDFREFFGLKRHATFEDISGNAEVQQALRDLYEHPDKVELYPGVFCESDVKKNGDPGPSDRSSALWAAIFSDAITLVRSDRFYTVDWNVNSLTSWGMKEVTPDNDVLKSSVFHRLLQRAFPEWFPSDSVRFFHPFYTGQKNAQYAKEQRYDEGFKMKTVKLAARDWLGRKKEPKEEDVFNISESEPKKPEKPLYLSDFATIKALLEDTSDVIVHPARLHLEDLPEDVKAVLEPRQSSETKATDGFKTNSAALSDYFTGIARGIIKREFITIDPSPNHKVYQIDMARDFAIPVVTRYVADFLGFGHLVRTETNMSAPYSENDIYQHIANCQVYLSYNSDETKLLKRRKAFKDSMHFLFDLTLKGHMATANRFFLTRKLRDASRFCFGAKWNSMEQLGLEISQTILQQENYKAGRAAAILLLVGLDNAYNTALAFNAVLSKFIGDLYKEAAAATAGKEKPFCDWLQIQDLVFEEPASERRGEKIEETVEHLILAAERQSVKIPIIRHAVEDHDILDPTNPQRILVSVGKDQTIVCDYNPDVHPPSSPTTAQTPSHPWENTFFAHRSLFATSLAPYHPNHLRILSLRCMLTATATLRNLRRGHDTQGLLKRVRITSSSEGFANYMAPQRVKKIAADVADEIARVKRDTKLSKKEKEEQVKKWEGVYTKGVLRPETTTYLTPEWDEMVPFPTTWKLRFDGFGWSDYGARETLKALWRVDEVAKEFALMAPFYEAPGGESRVGGSFKTATCVCVGKECKCAGKVGEGEVREGKAKKAPGARIWH
ncbi:hypothetical protein B0T25DRAFT_576792 [Lasiosphaeria hispida]|uniref:Heme peroxidase n=1 Tax=Lasiosphaeria hispida TaxID=260671 RepID=A0AAJ0HXQ5_9PEZI|nr:hypothetical protein B0T25DRAFT_576792 [Lasiosphaeria hispida]